MKKYLLFFSSLLLITTSCSLKVDQPKAKQLIENLLNDLKNDKLDAIDQYYASSSIESESLEKKKEKFIRLKEAIGSIKTFEFISATDKYDDYTNIKYLELIYKVQGEKLTVKETFNVMSDEGDLKIISQNIENMK